MQKSKKNLYIPDDLFFKLQLVAIKKGQTPEEYVNDLILEKTAQD